MDGSKRGYANLCSCRQLLPTYGRLRILRESLFGAYDITIRERHGTSCRDEFHVLVVFLTLAHIAIFLFFQIL